MRTRTTLLTVLSLAALAATACSSSDDTEPGGGGSGTTTTGAGTTTSGTTTGSGGTGGSGTGSTGCNQNIGDGGSDCTGAGAWGAAETQTVDTVTADIVDLSDAPAAGIVADVCGTNRCENATADASGHVSVNAGGSSFDDVRLLYGDGIDWVKFAAPLPSVPDAAFGTIHAVALPAMASGVAFVPGQEITSGDVTLGLAGDSFIEFNTLYYCQEAEQGFRAATIPLGGSESFPAIDGSASFELAYGMAPIDTKICPPAQMTVPNGAGWAADAEVEFFYQGTSIFEDFAKFGDWEKVSEGTVSADGNTVQTNAGEGIPELGVIAIRLKP